MLNSPNPELDPAIDVVEDTPGLVRYRLPPRGLGRWRKFVRAAALALCGIFVWFLWNPLSALVAGAVNFATIQTLVVRLVILLFVAGAPLKWLLNLLYGRVEIEVSSVELRVLRKLWWSTRTSSYEIRMIKCWQVVEIIPRVSSAQTAENSFDSLCTLTGVATDGKRFVIASAYPRGLLDSLVAAISSHQPQSDYGEGEQQLPTGEPASEPPAIAEPLSLKELVAEFSSRIISPEPAESYVQPRESRIRYEILADGLNMEIPPAGVWAGSAGLFQFGLILAAFDLLLTTLFSFAGDGVTGPLYALLAMSPFWLAAILMLLGGWNMGNRHLVIAVVGDQLKVLQISPLKTRQLDWMRSEINRIDIGPSGTEINDVPVPELQILGLKGKLFGMLAGYDPKEIIWVATLLRHALDQRPFPPEVAMPQRSVVALGAPAEPVSGRDGGALTPTGNLPREIAGFYSDSLGESAIVMGRMALFFCWVPILGLMMTSIIGTLGLLLAGIGLVLGLVRGEQLRQRSLKAAGICLLAIALSAASTGVVFYLLKQR